MAESEFIAGSSVVDRYVRSLYEVALKNGHEKVVADDLVQVRDSVIALGDYRKFLKRISFLSEYGQKFIDFLENNLKLSHEVSNFLQLLLENNRFSLIVGICNAYVAFLEKKDGKKVFYVTLARESEKTVEDIRRRLADVFGGKIECVTRIDPAIKDGFKVQYNSKVLDYSLKSKLRRLRTAIRRESYEN